ncbi:MAG: flagellin [Pseudobutyrivibrio sp.]|nr:flagellin [Pseudobutyrivibrio sp.]
MRINNNMSAVITNNQLLGTESSLSDVMEKLSSGFNINHASDNPSGIAIAAKMQAQIDGLSQASTNGSDGISVLQTAEGALNEVTEMIQRMRELAVQAANGTNSDDEKSAIQKEINSLLDEIDRVADTTEFNSINLLNGSLDSRIYAEHCTRMQSSTRVPAGIYQLDIKSAATQGMATSSGAGNETFQQISNNDYLNVTTTTSISIPAMTGFKDFIDGTSWSIDKNGTETASGTGLGISGSISINGYGISLLQGSSGESVYGQLRDACEKGGAIITDPQYPLEIKSEKFGANANLKIEFSSVEFARALGFDTADFTIGENGPVIEKVGEDAVVELYTEDQTAVPSLFGKQATVNYDGNHITVKDTKGFELSFYAEAGFDATTDASATDKGRITFNVTDIGSMSLQVGANKGQSMDVRIAAVTTEFMYIDDVDVTKKGGPEDAMNHLATALNYVTAVRSQLGAYENRLDHTTKSLDATEENMTSAISRIEDTDMATTMVEYTKLNVLEQAGMSALAQANELPQLALQLLQ